MFKLTPTQSTTHTITNHFMTRANSSGAFLSSALEKEGVGGVLERLNRQRHKDR